MRHLPPLRPAYRLTARGQNLLAILGVLALFAIVGLAGGLIERPL